MGKRVIKLTRHEDLKVYMSPQRQKILRSMRLYGEAMTPKTIADLVGISASSVQFHIKKLEKLGVVELDHTDVINGILAKYYRLSDVDISISTQIEDSPSKEQFIILENFVKDTFDGLLELYESGMPQDILSRNSEFLNGTIHLTEEDAQEFLEYIRDFIVSREKKSEGAQPWEFTFMLYNAESRKGFGKKEEAQK